MRDALKHIEEIQARTKSGCMLLLDFDGTLAPIVPDPNDAQLAAGMREVLVACAQRCRIAVISGRALQDIKRRVGIETLWYAGSHGLEWSVDGETAIKETPEPQRSAMSAVRAIFAGVRNERPRIIFEDKVHCAALNYRALSPDDAERFRGEMRERVAGEVYKGLRIMDGMGTFEIVPAMDWTKGECARMLLTMARGRSGVHLTPLYVGDSITDEDAFKALQDGITIRVGADAASAAEFSVPAQADVAPLLRRLCEQNTL